MNMAAVVVVRIADMRNFPEHNCYCNGFNKLVQRCEHIMAAEALAAKYAVEQPLPPGERYEAFHWWD